MMVIKLQGYEIEIILKHLIGHTLNFKHVIGRFEKKLKFKHVIGRFEKKLNFKHVIGCFGCFEFKLTNLMHKFQNLTNQMLETLEV